MGTVVASYQHRGGPTLICRLGKTVTSFVRRRKLQLLGHVALLSQDVPARRMLEAASRTPPTSWQRPRGRPQATWSSQVAAHGSLETLLDIAQD